MKGQNDHDPAPELGTDPSTNAEKEKKGEDNQTENDRIEQSESVQVAGND